MIKGLKAVIFDMDGTLIELKLRIKDAKKEIIDMLIKEGFDVSNVDVNTPVLEILRLISNSEKEESLKHKAKRNVFDILTKYETEAASQSKLKKGMELLLKELKEKGIKVALATNNSKRSVEEFLNNTGVKGIFDVIVTRDDVNSLKPSKEMLEKAIAMMSVKPYEVAFIGDSMHDIVAAKATGVISIAILGGFHGKEELISKDPDYIVPNVEELRKLLLKLII